MLYEVITNSVFLDSVTRTITASGDPRILRDESVITSYSIHYTKLYDLEIGEHGLFQLQQCVLPLRRLADIGTAHAADTQGDGRAQAGAYDDVQAGRLADAEFTMQYAN